MNYRSDYPVERLVYFKKSMFFEGIELPSLLSTIVGLSCLYSIRNINDATQVLTRFSADIVDGKVVIDGSVLEQLNSGSYTILLMYKESGVEVFYEKKRLKIEDL